MNIFPSRRPVQAFTRVTRGLIVLLPVLFPLSTGASEPCYTPKDNERRALIDAVRKPVSAELKQPVEFVSRKLRVCGDGSTSWAFVDLKPQKPDGLAVDWEASGFFDCAHQVNALLKRPATGEDWTVIESAVCPSDVPWAVWSEQYGAPAELFQD